MAASWKRRSLVLLLAGAAAFGAWTVLPGSVIDRIVFRSVVSGFANPPFFVSGNGSHAEPWTLRTLSSIPRIAPDAAPQVVSIGDDPGGIFQTSPPSPVDMAVILRNLRRLGADEVAIAAWMAWDEPDVISLAALELELDEFRSIVTAAPLSRGAVADLLPPAFREASLPLSAVAGDTSALPQVNRVPLPGVVLAGKAGFTVLESEPGEGLPLLARWDDRVMLAFPVVALLQRKNLPLDGVEVRLGEHLRLSAGGPVVLIDASGRLAARLPKVPARTEISAEELIDLEDEIFAGSPPVMRDMQSAADPAMRRFSGMLPSVMAAIASDAGLSPPMRFRRLPEKWELGALAVIVLLAAAAGTFSAFRKGLLLTGLAGLCLSAQWLGAGLVDAWLPGLPALAAVAVAAIPSRLPRRRDRAATPVPAVEARPTEPEAEPAPAPQKQPPGQQDGKPAAKAAGKSGPKKSRGKKKAGSRKSARKKPSSPES